MDLIKLKNREDFLYYLESVKELRKNFEDMVTKMGEGSDIWYLNGFCEACQKESAFLIDWNYSNKFYPNYRERVLCVDCNLNNRQRFMAGLIKKILSEKK